MSVDTYLKGKNLSSYQRIEKGDVEVYLSPELNQWAGYVGLYVQNLIVRKRIKADVEHNHNAACKHRH